MLDKSKINFLVDSLMFLCMTAIAGLGFLMKFVLIPGKDRWVKYGRNVELRLLGMDRHEWGTIHLIIGFTLLTALTIHIILHWKMIVGIYERLIETRRTRNIVAVVFVAAAAAFILFPFAVKPEVQELRRGHAAEGFAGCAFSGLHEIPSESICAPEMHVETDAAQEGRAEIGVEEEAHSGVGSPLGIRGYMTLAEVAGTHNVPADYLKERLGLPLSTSGNEKLGWLRKRYGFTMHDVEKIIEEYRKAHEQ
jgi:hypothetical protein